MTTPRSPEILEVIPTRWRDRRNCGTILALRRLRGNLGNDEARHVEGAAKVNVDDHVKELLRMNATLRVNLNSG